MSFTWIIELDSIYVSSKCPSSCLGFLPYVGENIIKYSKNVMDWAIKSPKIYLATNKYIHFLKDTFRFRVPDDCRQAEYVQYMCSDADIDRVTSPMLILISAI